MKFHHHVKMAIRDGHSPSTAVKIARSMAHQSHAMAQEPAEPAPAAEPTVPQFGSPTDEPNYGAEAGEGPSGMANGGMKNGHLTTEARKKMKPGSFALPGKKYPINDAGHARNALSRVSQFGSPEEKAKVRGAVHRKFPGIGK